MDLSIFSKNLIRFILLILIQLLLLDNIQLSQLGVRPSIYGLFILLLPINLPKASLLIFSFLMGFSIDIFSDTGGLHTFACVFMAFVRPAILNTLVPRAGYDTSSSPNLKDMGIVWFVKYTSLMIFAHQTTFFFMESLSFQNIGLLLIKILLSALFSLIVILVSQFIIFKNE